MLDQVEVWRDVPDKEGYQVSNLGNFRSCRFGGKYSPGRWRNKKLNRQKGGYYHANFCIGGVFSGESIGPLVLRVFVGPCPEDMECCHEDGNPSHNWIENLRWDTHESNMRDKIKHGTLYEGEECHLSILTPAQVLEARSMRIAGWAYPKIGSKFGVSDADIKELCDGKIWKSITGGVPVLKDPLPEGMRRCGKCKLIKEINAFHLNRGKPNSKCKVCAIKDASEWNKNNKERRRCRESIN